MLKRLSYATSYGALKHLARCEVREHEDRTASVYIFGAHSGDLDGSRTEIERRRYRDGRPDEYEVFMVDGHHRHVDTQQTEYAETIFNAVAS